MQTHELKCENPYFSDMWIGDKDFDIRLDDRGFQKGDLLWQREFSPAHGYSGRELIQVVRYIIPAGLLPGLTPEYCAMGVKTLQQRINQRGDNKK